MFGRFEAEIFVGAIFSVLIAFQVWVLSLPVPELELAATSPAMNRTDSVADPYVADIESGSRP
ncbi:MAG TPA: hypothetical protein VK913_12160 [Erythrobacter sp.]|nr:hypothetical protein [Erythrobacter sp.]